MINGADIERKIHLIKIKKIIESGELYMFNAKLTKQEHDLIKQNFEKMIEESSKEVERQEKIVKVEDSSTEFEKLINLKNNLSN